MLFYSKVPFSMVNSLVYVCSVLFGRSANTRGYEVSSTYPCRCIAGKSFEDKSEMFHLKTLSLSHKASLGCCLLPRLKFFDLVHVCRR
jgi:hypothetical protein